MDIDPSSEDFMKNLLDMIVYRKGYYGTFAEGMPQPLMKGKDKFGNTFIREEFPIVSYTVGCSY
jgi:hypothetical protein